MASTHIKDIMSSSCQWISPDASLQDAAKMMKDQDIGFLPVGQNDKLIGTITDRDIVVTAIAAGQNPTSAKVADHMTQKLYYCYDDQTVNDICKNMAEMKVSRFPVVNRAKRLVGVVSYSDLAAAASADVFLAAEQELKSIASAKKAA